MLNPSILLAAALALLVWFVRNDRAEYEKFKALTRTEDRQRAFRRWTIKSFFLFSATSLAVLLLLGRPGTPIVLPAEFEILSYRLNNGPGGFGLGFVFAMAGALIGGGVSGAFIRSRLRRRPFPSRPQKLLGDIAPMLPRNAEERWWTALLGSNAGFGEELFFRLMLPLLITLVTGSAIAAFAAAGLIFGLVHYYQGWVGIAATTFMGFLLTALYLASGMLWVAMAVHALVNLNTLWLQPLLAEGRGESNLAHEERD